MKRFCDLDAQDFRGATVFLDMDGTLVPDGEEEPAPAEAHVLSALTKEAQVYLLASKGYYRISAIAKKYQAEAIVSAYKKPSRKVLRGIAVPRWSRVVIGDKVMTDGWFASRIGAKFVHVARLTNGEESLVVRCLYAVDAVIGAGVSAWRLLMHSTLLLYVRVARPTQWWKNLLMFIPIFLSGLLTDPHALVSVLFGVIAFSASASMSYVMNDIIDCEVDTRNPAKRSRPIACGLIPIPHAIAFAFFLALVAIAAAAEVPAVIPWVMAYLILTHVYTFYLKRFPVVELFAISGFYILRLLGGGAAGGVEVSPLLTVFILFAALLAATGGRYAESKRPYPHAIVRHYPDDFLKLLPVFCAMVTLVTAMLVAFSGTSYFFLTTALVSFAIVWYLRSIYRAEGGVSADERLWDSIVLWGSLALLIAGLGIPYA
jgi:4-hydroxybenzoate polyprenyltransferase/predicted HAD superfamily phosphohydrolase YqeG